MCIAIVKPVTRQVSDEVLRKCASSNPDGGGYAFVKDGKVVIRKGFMDIESFLTSYHEDLAANINSVFIIHFRISTGGDKSEANTHPFGNEEVALIHNGYFFYPGNSGPSDTSILADTIMGYLTKENMQDKVAEFGNIIGAGNKVAMLFKDNTYLIANQDRGVWDNGVWYSHGGYKVTSSAWPTYCPTPANGATYNTGG
jgi:glutamine phosphoribosylpyrophosphate amidotransferase